MTGISLTIQTPILLFWLQLMHAQYDKQTDISSSRVQLLVEAMQPVHVALRLRAHGPQLKPHTAIPHLAPQLPQTLDPDVLQTVLQAREQVGNELGHGAPVQHAPRHPLGDEEPVALTEVPGRPGVRLLRRLRHGAGLLVLHGVDAAHAPVRLDELALAADKVVARRLRRASKQAPHHHRARAQREALDNVSHVLDPAVGDAGDAEPGGEARHVEDGCGLGSAHGHDFLRYARRAGTHADPEPVDAGGDQGSGLRDGDDVAANHVEIWVLSLYVFDHFDLEDGIALRGIEDDDVETGVCELFQSIFILWSGADGRGADELLRVWELGGERIV